MMHKCINKLVPDYLVDVFKLCSHAHNRQQDSALLVTEEQNSVTP